MILGGMLLCALVLAGCDQPTNPSNQQTSSNSKTIKITGFPLEQYKDKILVIVLMTASGQNIDDAEPEAVGGVQISGTTLTIPLYTDFTDTGFGPSWKGSGSYCIMFAIERVYGTQDDPHVEIEKVFVYSDGSTVDEDSEVKVYHITNTVSSIPFDKFYDVTDWAQKYFPEE
jgi:hypothetical protein